MSFSAQTERRAMAEMNITPLVDVMLVLLVIFMITAPQMTHQVSLPLPQRCTDCPEPKKETPATLRIAAQGQIYWDGALLDLDGLSEQLRIHAKATAPLIIQSTDDALYADVAAVFAAVGKAGIKRVQMQQ